MDGAETWQSEGNIAAFVILTLRPILAAFFKPSHTHSASASITVSNPVQHEGEGFGSAGPLFRKDMQSNMSNINSLQSTAAGDGALDSGFAVVHTALPMPSDKITRIYVMPQKRMFFSMVKKIRWLMVDEEEDV